MDTMLFKNVKRFIKRGKEMNDFHQSPVIYVRDVSLKVQNLERSIEFYIDVIGFKLLQKEGNKAYMTADGKQAILTLEQPEDVVPKQGRTAGLYHFAILLPTRKDLSKFLRHIAEIRYPIGAGDHLVSEALYLNDLDGNGIEVYRDRPPETWKWNGELVHMDTLPVDFEDLLAETAEPWQGLPADTKMGHIHLHVSDLSKAEKFYTEGLGFDIVSYYPNAIFLSSGKYHHHVAINTWAGVGVPPTPENGVGLKSYTVVLPDEEKRQETVQRLQALGAPVKKDGEIYITKDPSQNTIHLVLEDKTIVRK